MYCSIVFWKSVVAVIWYLCNAGWTVRYVGLTAIFDYYLLKEFEKLCSLERLILAFSLLWAVLYMHHPAHRPGQCSSPPGAIIPIPVTLEQGWSSSPQPCPAEQGPPTALCSQDWGCSCCPAAGWGGTCTAWQALPRWVCWGHLTIPSVWPCGTHQPLDSVWLG